MTRARDFDDDTPGAGDFTGAQDAGVGAFHGLDRHDGFIFDHDSLADILAGDDPRERNAEGNIGFFCRT